MQLPVQVFYKMSHAICLETTLKPKSHQSSFFSHVSDLLKFFDNLYSLDSKASNEEKKLFVENALTVLINYVIYLTR